MDIVFTKHAQEKFVLLKRFGVHITAQKVIETVRIPQSIDYSRCPLLIAQASLDRSHVVRVVYREESNQKIIITFYPGRKTHYEKENIQT